MAKWSVGIQRQMVWSHHPEAPWFDTEEEAATWMRGWLETQPEPTRQGLYSVREHLMGGDS